MSFRRNSHAAVALTLLLLAAGCGRSEEEFHQADEKGWFACWYFDSAQGAGGSNYLFEIGAAAEIGLEAKTPEIRAAVDDRDGDLHGSPVIADLRAFKKACSNAGYDFD